MSGRYEVKDEPLPCPPSHPTPSNRTQLAITPPLSYHSPSPLDYFYPNQMQLQPSSYDFMHTFNQFYYPYGAIPTAKSMPQHSTLMPPVYDFSLQDYNSLLSAAAIYATTPASVVPADDCETGCSPPYLSDSNDSSKTQLQIDESRSSSTPSASELTQLQSFYRPFEWNSQFGAHASPNVQPTPPTTPIPSYASTSGQIFNTVPVMVDANNQMRATTTPSPSGCSVWTTAEQPTKPIVRMQTQPSRAPPEQLRQTMPAPHIAPRSLTSNNTATTTLIQPKGYFSDHHQPTTTPNMPHQMSSYSPTTQERFPTTSSAMIPQSQPPKNAKRKREPLMQTPPPPIHCIPCDKTFGKMCYLRQHQKAYHSGEKPYRCQRCGKRFPTEQAYNVHAMKHTAAQKEFKCTACPKQFHYKTDLVRHCNMIHLASTANQCDCCGKCFSRRDHLAKHIATHTREDPTKSFSMPKKRKLTTDRDELAIAVKTEQFYLTNPFGF